jgi:hypothetical protein
VPEVLNDLDINPTRAKIGRQAVPKPCLQVTEKGGKTKMPSTLAGLWSRRAYCDMVLPQGIIQDG